MRIFQICTAQSLGGLELYFVSCCEQLGKRGHELIAVVREGSSLEQMLISKGIRPHTVSGGIWKNLQSLRQLIRGTAPNIVHIHHKKDLLLGALLKVLSNKTYKYVHTRQMDLPGNKKNLYHSFIYGRIDLLIAITEKLKDQVLKRISINPRKVVTLYYGVPLLEGKQDRCLEIKLNPDLFNIGCVARVDHKKEQHILIEALGLLIKEGVSNVHVYLVGGTTDKEYHKQILDLIEQQGSKSHISLTGFLETPQELMNCFDAILLTTGNETFGLVLPEAMRMGVPVIGANGGGVPEIITNHETGLLFEPGNPESLKKAIIEMMDEEKRKSLAINGKKEADKRFDIGSHFDQLEILFEN